MTTPKKPIYFVHANHSRALVGVDMIVNSVTGGKYALQAKNYMGAASKNIHLTHNDLADLYVKYLFIDDEVQPPPPWAEFLLELFAAKTVRDSLVGDFNEEFHKNCMEPGGVARARRIYWAGVLRSLTPLIWNKAKKAGFFGLVVAAVKYFTR
jgi:hypothetical protein